MQRGVCRNAARNRQRCVRGSESNCEHDSRKCNGT
jgi:hypothetical protein